MTVAERSGIMTYIVESLGSDLYAQPNLKFMKRLSIKTMTYFKARP
jgi:hypothetical protein